MIRFWIAGLFLSGENLINHRKQKLELARCDAEIRKTKSSERKFWGDLFSTASEQGVQTFLILLCIAMAVAPPAVNVVLTWNQKPRIESTLFSGVHEIGKLGFFALVNISPGTKKED